jgi:hypothetical protein
MGKAWKEYRLWADGCLTLNFTILLGDLWRGHYELLKSPPSIFLGMYLKFPKLWSKFRKSLRKMSFLKLDLTDSLASPGHNRGQPSSAAAWETGYNTAASVTVSVSSLLWCWPCPPHPSQTSQINKAKVFGDRSIFDANFYGFRCLFFSSQLRVLWQLDKCSTAELYP